MRAVSTTRASAHAARRGSTRVILLLAGVLVLGFGALFLLMNRGSNVEPHEALAAQIPTQAKPSAGSAELSVPTSDGDRTQGALRAENLSYQAGPASFDGRGVIRGEVVAAKGVVLPKSWDLVLEPHPFLQGSERAVYKRVELRAGERTFRVEDLPLGGYRVRAESNGLNVNGADVLLIKGAADQFVTLRFAPSGTFDGSVIDAQGRPAEGLDVVLTEKDSKQSRTCVTDAAGAYSFAAVLDGTYTLAFGKPIALLPLETVEFKAPALHYPSRLLPATATLRFEVLDTLAKPAAKASVRGFGAQGGSLDLRTDGEGHAIARYLRAGSWRIDVYDERDEQQAHAVLELASDEDRALQIRMHL